MPQRIPRRLHIPPTRGVLSGGDPPAGTVCGHQRTRCGCRRDPVLPERSAVTSEPVVAARARSMRTTCDYQPTFGVVAQGIPQHRRGAARRSNQKTD